MAETPRAHDGRGGRPILSLKSVEPAPESRSQLPGIEQVEDGGFASELQRWTAALWDARNRWDIARRGGGLFGAGRVTRDQAPAMLAKALRALEAAQ